MNIRKIIIDQDNIIIFMEGYGCNSNSKTDNKKLIIRHSSDLENTLRKLGIELQ